MERLMHSFDSLFAQLGLQSAPEDIRTFIESHGPLSEHLALHEAPFWSASQSAFLLESVQNDADWSGVTDGLNAALRKPRNS